MASFNPCNNCIKLVGLVIDDGKDDTAYVIHKIDDWTMDNNNNDKTKVTRTAIKVNYYDNEIIVVIILTMKVIQCIFFQLTLMNICPTSLESSNSIDILSFIDETANFIKESSHNEPYSDIFDIFESMAFIIMCIKTFI